MKKLFLLFCLICSLSSCNTYTIANITAFKPNGEILCEYKNIHLGDNAFKRFGLNFYDGKRFVVLPNSLPYKVEYIVIDYCIFDEYSKKNILYDINSGVYSSDDYK